MFLNRLVNPICLKIYVLKLNSDSRLTFRRKTALVEEPSNKIYNDNQDIKMLILIIPSCDVTRYTFFKVHSVDITFHCIEKVY